MAAADSPIRATDLLAAAGLECRGPQVWGAPVVCHAPGVYVVETDRLYDSAPIDPAHVSRWLDRVPGLRLDRASPDAPALVQENAAMSLRWAEADPTAAEAVLFEIFRRALRLRDPSLAATADHHLLPFANLQLRSGKLKPHGITGQSSLPRGPKPT